MPPIPLAPGLIVNPVIDSDFPDPGFLCLDDFYFAYATNSKRVLVQVARSCDLIHWEYCGDALSALPGWAVQRFGLTWAPEVVPAPEGDGFLLYYVTRFRRGLANGRQSIAVARAERPEGPFVTIGGPLVCDLSEGGDIDPQVFIEDNGDRYLLYKNDGNSCGKRTWIYLQRLSDDGLSLVGNPVRLLTTDRSWEGQLVEAPTLWKRDGKYFLFYSANAFVSSQYAIGCAVADRLSGPYCKTDGPLLATNRELGIVGPGGQDIFADGDGLTWLAFHSWSPGRYRQMNIARLNWDGDRPTVHLDQRQQGHLSDDTLKAVGHSEYIAVG